MQKSGSVMRTQLNLPAAPSCLHCRQSMRFVGSISQIDGLGELQTFECYPCDLAFTGEAVAEAQQMGRQAIAA
jgi:hypothetical protein